LTVVFHIGGTQVVIIAGLVVSTTKINRHVKTSQWIARPLITTSVIGDRFRRDGATTGRVRVTIVFYARIVSSLTVFGNMFASTVTRDGKVIGTRVMIVARCATL